MPENTEARDIIDTAQEAVEPYLVNYTDGSGIYLVRNADGGTEAIDLREQLGRLPDRPPRKTGHTTLTDVDSYSDALTKHALPETELFANARVGTIKAVINAHLEATEDGLENEAGFGDHTITLNLPKTPDWDDWAKRDGQLFPQLEFSEFIEDHLPNFVDPTGADMLELAQTFQATTKVDFASSQRINSGETQLLYTEQQNATAGKKGTLAIPDSFTLALQPFERGPVYRVPARFRYRINGGTLLLGYRLTRPDDVLRTAFDEVIAKVQSDTGRTVWHAA